MGRKYKKRTDRVRDPVALENAFKEVKDNNASARKAAAKYGVARSTLLDYLRRDRNTNQGFKLATYTIRQVLTSEMEKNLAEYLLQCSRMFHGLSTTITKRLAYEYAVANNVLVPESWKRNESAGKDWLTGFLERQNNLSLRTPEATSLQRITSFNKTNLGIFQKKLEEVLTRFALTESSIYNLDETGCTTVQKVAKVIAGKGVHQVGQVTARERGELVTMVGIVSANGNALPPVFIFPRVRFDEARMMNGVSPGCRGLVHPSGWMTSSNFIHVLQHFVIHTRSSKEHKVLLIMDNHESHLSVDGINFARENGIVILTLPPHTSNKLQPLDRSVFGPFKTFYNQGVNSWNLQHPGRVITIYDIPPLMCNAWDRAATPVNVKSGFRSTGIHPFDINVFTEEDFSGALVTDRPEPSCQLMQQSPTPAEISSTSEQSKEALAAVPTSSVSSQPNLGSAQMTPQTSASPHQDPNEVDISPEHIRPYPKAPARKDTCRGKRKGKCMIVTDTPEKNEIEERKT